MQVGNKTQQPTMYIQNRRDSTKFSGCSPLQLCNGLISLKPAIAYFEYTKRWQQVGNPRQTKSIRTEASLICFFYNKKDSFLLKP